MLRELTESDLDLAKLIEVDEFVGMCIEGELDDSDGYGLLVIDGEVNPKKEIAPSSFHDIPDHVTDILWFNI